MPKQKFYKVLGKGGKCCNGGMGKWHLPKNGKPGKWMPKIEGELVACENGYHLCRAEDLVCWLHAEIYEAEYKGEIIQFSDKVVVREARLLRKIDAWNDKTARLFAVDCAKHVLWAWDKYYPNDKRPHQAVQAAYDYANGKISEEELTVACDAAYAAAVAYYAAYSAAYSAANYAAERKWQARQLKKYLKIKRGIVWKI